MREKKIDVLNFSLNLIIFILVFLNLTIFSLKIDLTRNKTFKISKVTKNILNNIDDKLYITYYVSNKLEDYYAFPRRIKNFLEAYSNVNSKKVVFKVVDADSANVALERIGLNPQNIDMTSSNQMSILKVFSGIEIRYQEKSGVIPFVEDITSIEYDLTSKIDKIINERENIIGIIWGDYSLKQVHQVLPQFLKLELDAEVKEIQKDEAIENISSLFVIGEKDIDESEAKKIDEYLMRDGKALILANKIDFNMQNPYGTMPINSPLLNILESYGIEVESNLIMDVNSALMLIGNSIQNYFAWIKIDADNIIEKTNPITKNIYRAIIPWSSSLKVTKGNFKPLIESSSKSWIEEQNFTGLVYNTFEVPEKFDESPFKLAYSFEGPLKSAFSEKSSLSSRLVVIGSKNIFSDYVYQQRYTENFTLSGAIAEFLTQRSEFYEIKTRVVKAKLNITNLEDIMRERTKFIIINLIILPIIILSFGIVRHVKRKSI